VRVIFATTIAIPHRPRHLAASASPSPTSRIAIDIMLRISWSTRGHLPLHQSALLKHLAQSLHSAAHKQCTCVTPRGCALLHLAAQSSCSIPTSSGVLAQHHRHQASFVCYSQVRGSLRAPPLAGCALCISQRRIIHAGCAIDVFAAIRVVVDSASRPQSRTGILSTVATRAD